MNENFKEVEIKDENIINENKVVEGNSINLKGMQNFIITLDKKIVELFFLILMVQVFYAKFHIQRKTMYLKF